MHNKKKAYYRNYYQENLARREAQYERTQMRPYSTVDSTRYKANHQHQQPLRQPRHQKDTMELSLHTDSTGSDMLRGLALGLPLLIGIVVVMYATGLFTVPTVEETLVSTYGENSVSYLTDYDALVTTQNKMNELIAVNIKQADSSTVAKAELANYVSQIQTLTKKLDDYDIESFNRLGSLFELSLLSVNTLVDVINQAEVSDETIDSTYAQFVMDQNSVGTQIVTELETLLKAANISVEKGMGGKLELNMQ